jgi:hypothetical protein
MRRWGFKAKGAMGSHGLRRFTVTGVVEAENPVDALDKAKATVETALGESPESIRMKEKRPREDVVR